MRRAEAVRLLSCALCLATSVAVDLIELADVYNNNAPPPDGRTDVSISLFINRVSAVDENKEEISLDVFLNVQWKDDRVRPTNKSVPVVELTWEQRSQFWVPDLYIRQLREMRVLSLFQEMTSVRVYQNSTLRISIGATVIIKCDMDFVLYPLDVQKCAVDFSSYKYTDEDMAFRWARDEPPLSFPSDFGGDGYRLPKYVVSFKTEKDAHLVYYGEGNHSTARLVITLSRELRSYLLESYLPSSLFVIMSWGSFVVMPDLVPGRMVLLVTTLLSLVTMFDTVRNNSPNALELKCIEVWLISCTLFVFFALIEYFVVLFGIRYDKHWRHRRRDLDRTSGAVPTATPVPTIQTPVATTTSATVNNNSNTIIHAETNNTSSLNNSLSHNNTPVPPPPPPPLGQLPPLLHRRKVAGSGVAGGGGGVTSGASDHGSALPSGNVTGSMTGLGSSSSRIDNLRLFGTSKVGPRGDAAAAAAVAAVAAAARANLRKNAGPGWKASRGRFRLAAEHAVLYAGSTRGTVDQVSLVLFPVCFALFATVYWIIYVSESRSRLS